MIGELVKTHINEASCSLNKLAQNMRRTSAATGEVIRAQGVVSIGFRKHDDIIKNVE